MPEREPPRAERLAPTCANAQLWEAGGHDKAVTILERWNTGLRETGTGAGFL